MLKYKLYLKEILNAIEKIEDSLKDKNKEDFDKDEILKDATYMRIQIIGENINNLPKSIKDKYPNVKWNRIKDSRDIISHAYSYVHSELIWSLIKTELPKLKEVINEISKKEK